MLVFREDALNFKVSDGTDELVIFFIVFLLAVYIFL